MAPAPSGVADDARCLMRAWQQHERELRRWLIYHSGDVALGEDLLHDLFLRALRHKARFCTLDNARAWLFEVGRNLLRDHARGLRPFAPLPDELPGTDSEDLAPVDTLAVCLPRALAELSAQDREAIECCDLGGMSQADYAARVQLSLAGAKSRVQRARERLKRVLMTRCQVRFDTAGRICCFTPRAPEAATAGGEAAHGASTEK